MILAIKPTGYNLLQKYTSIKTPMTLSREESATLVGMLKNSSLFNPKRRPEMTRKRLSNVFFQQMYRNEFISEEEKESLQQLPKLAVHTRFASRRIGDLFPHLCKTIHAKMGKRKPKSRRRTV